MVEYVSLLNYNYVVRHFKEFSSARDAYLKQTPTHKSMIASVKNLLNLVRYLQQWCIFLIPIRLIFRSKLCFTNYVLYWKNCFFGNKIFICIDNLCIAHSCFFSTQFQERQDILIGAGFERKHLTIWFRNNAVIISSIRTNKKVTCIQLLDVLG